MASTSTSATPSSSTRNAGTFIKVFQKMQPLATTSNDSGNGNHQQASQVSTRGRRRADATGQLKEPAAVGAELSQAQSIVAAINTNAKCQLNESDSMRQPAAASGQRSSRSSRRQQASNEGRDPMRQSLLNSNNTLVQSNAQLQLLYQLEQKKGQRQEEEIRALHERIRRLTSARDEERISLLVADRTKRKLVQLRAIAKKTIGALESGLREFSDFVGDLDDAIIAEVAGEGALGGMGDLPLGKEGRSSYEHCITKQFEPKLARIAESPMVTLNGGSSTILSSAATTSTAAAFLQLNNAIINSATIEEGVLPPETFAADLREGGNGGEEEEREEEVDAIILANPLLIDPHPEGSRKPKNNESDSARQHLHQEEKLPPKEAQLTANAPEATPTAITTTMTAAEMVQSEPVETEMVETIAGIERSLSTPPNSPMGRVVEEEENLEEGTEEAAHPPAENPTPAAVSSNVTYTVAAAARTPTAPAASMLRGVMRVVEADFSPLAVLTPQEQAAEDLLAHQQQQPPSKGPEGAYNNKDVEQREEREYIEEEEEEIAAWNRKRYTALLRRNPSMSSFLVPGDEDSEERGGIGEHGANGRPAGVEKRRIRSPQCCSTPVGGGENGETHRSGQPEGGIATRAANQGGSKSQRAQLDPSPAAAEATASVWLDKVTKRTGSTLPRMEESATQKETSSVGRSKKKTVPALGEGKENAEKNEAETHHDSSSSLGSVTVIKQPASQADKRSNQLHQPPHPPSVSRQPPPEFETPPLQNGNLVDNNATTTPGGKVAEEHQGGANAKGVKRRAPALVAKPSKEIKLINLQTQVTASPFPVGEGQCHHSIQPVTRVKRRNLANTSFSSSHSKATPKRGTEGQDMNQLSVVDIGATPITAASALGSSSTMYTTASSSVMAVEEGSARQRRGVANKVVSYKEPKLNTKMRREE